MLPTVTKSCLLILTVLFGTGTIFPTWTLAQQVVPADDGTGTQVNQEGNLLNITGGSRSASGANLFHSFTQFGLSADQTVNFVASPELQNILSRVTGGDPSIINGTLQITGGTPNLYLINPAGILFGQGASLNVPAAFTATTANGIGFGGGWLGATGTNDYSNLEGNPDTFAFTMSQPGAILNAGNLSVTQGQNLTLLGGTVVNTGQLSAPGGTLTLAAVPGENLVRLTQVGQLLSIEFQPLSTSPALPENWSLPIADLPALLTGGGGTHATGLTVNDAGQVEIIGSGLTVENGDVVAKSAIVTAGGATLSARNNLTLVGTQLTTTGDLQLFATNTVRVRADNALGNPLVARAGGNLFLRGLSGIDVWVPNQSQTPLQSDGNLNLVSDGVISGAARFASGSNFSILNSAGSPANFSSSTSPIISAVGDVTFGNYTGASLKVEVTGSIRVGTVSITQADPTATGTDPDIATLASSPSLILRAGQTILTNLPTASPNPLAPGGGTLSVSNLSTAGGPILLSAPIQITLTGSNIASTGGNITFDGPVILGTPELTINSQGGNLAFNSSVDDFNAESTRLNLDAGTGNITFGGAVGGNTRLGNLTISNATDVTANALLSAGTVQQTAGAGTTRLQGVQTTQSQGLNLTSDQIQIEGNISTDGGSVRLRATGNLSANNISTQSSVGSGGEIHLSSTNRDVAVGNLNSSGITVGGEISLAAGDDLTTRQVITRSDLGDAGDVTFIAKGGIRVEFIDARGGANGSGGEIDIRTGEFFRASGTFTDTNNILASLSNASVGDNPSNSIQIQHAGAQKNRPFVVGNAATNGTAGAITTGIDNTIAPTRSFKGNYTLGNIRILTTSIPPTSGGPITPPTQSVPTPTPAPVPTPAPTPVPPEQAPVSSQPPSPTPQNPGSIISIEDPSLPSTSPGDSPLSTGSDPSGGVTPLEGGSTQPGNSSSPSSATQGTTKPSSTSSGQNSPPKATSSNTGDSATQNSPPKETSSNTGDSATQNSPPKDSSPSSESSTSQMQTSNSTTALEGNTTSAELDASFTQKFEQYLEGSVDAPVNRLTEANTLRKIEAATGIKPALIYVVFVPVSVSPNASSAGSEGVTRVKEQGKEPHQSPFLRISKGVPKLINPPSSVNDSDQLELVMFTGSGIPVRKRIEGATRAQVLKTVQHFRSQVIKPGRNGFLQPAQQLYQWLVAPLENDLKTREINNLVFLMDTGLRSVPIAALHDGKKFLVEEYSIGLMPSLSLTDTRYVNIKKAQVLAMGASQFTNQRALPAVPLELKVITQQLWPGKYFLNDAFTLENLKTQRQENPYSIIHLATHGEFNRGAPSNSYIQLWGKRLRLNQMRQMGWGEPPVELLVLSACQTALGDEEAELGFAGLAVQAGVKSALASLWYVSDEGTLGLMTEFYRQLKVAPIKSEALRQAQIAMIEGRARIVGGQLINSAGTINLPTELSRQGNQDLTHPYYWASFTMIGNPW